MNNTRVTPGPAAGSGTRNPSLLRLMLVAVTGLVFFGSIAGCVAPIPPGPDPAAAAPTKATAKAKEVFTLQEGDVVRISFPGAPNLDSTQSIRRDGKITLAMMGEVLAIGRTPTELEQDLLKLYSNQLVSKEVTVLVVSSSYAVFVSGAVLRPGKILADRPLTALEAIMEAGGFDQTKADMTAVKVVRQEEGGTKNYVLNLKLVLEGKSTEPFFLKKSDIVYVPEKFSWF